MTPDITIITDSLSRRRGGAEIYMANLATFLAQHGRAVRVLVRRPSPDFSAPGVTVETVRVPGGGLPGEKDFARAVQPHLRSGHGVTLSTIAMPGITHYQPHMGLHRRGFLASRSSCDSLFARSLHGLGTQFNLKRRWLADAQERLLAHDSTTRIMVFSQLVRSQMLEDHPVPAANLTTAPLGVDLKCFFPAETKPDRRAEKLQLLFTGHNFRLKGLHCLLAAMSLAQKNGLQAELAIAGNGPRAAFEKIAARLGLAPHVRFLGLVDDEGVAALYRSSDALVHPTFSDHCSLVVLEALASGLPVVTTRQNGAAEFIENEKQGFVISHPRDLGALTDALLRLQDRRQLTAMSAAAAALRPRLDFNQHARQVLAWLA